jgi:hypothetical protein
MSARRPRGVSAQWVELPAPGPLQHVAESFGYLPVDLEATGHPTLAVAPQRLHIGVGQVFGEPIRKDLFSFARLASYPRVLRRHGAPSPGLTALSGAAADVQPRRRV